MLRQASGLSGLFPAYAYTCARLYAHRKRVHVHQHYRSRGKITRETPLTPTRRSDHGLGRTFRRRSVAHCRATFAHVGRPLRDAPTIPLRNQSPRVATRWPSPRLPLWQSERPAASRPIGTWRNLGKMRHAGTATKLVRVCFVGPNTNGGTRFALLRTLLFGGTCISRFSQQGGSREQQHGADAAGSTHLSDLQHASEVED